MKKLLVYINIMIVLVFYIVTPVSAASGIDEEKTNIELYARSAVLMDAETGRILYGKNELEQLPNASTTKILTCIIALELEPDLENIVTVSGYAASMPKVHLGMKTGEQYRLRDLLYSMMLESHNDSAVAIAEYIAGSTEHFAFLMNQKAREIGCKNSFFITPNGLDATCVVTEKNQGENIEKAHSTTAEDLAKIMSYCILYSSEKDEFLKITQTSNYAFQNRAKNAEGEMQTGTRSFSCTNHNAFLTMMEGALSGKTGYTGNASYCYVGALKNSDRYFVVALLASGWPGHKTYKWIDTRKLMNFGMSYFQKVNLWKEMKLPEIEVSNGISEQKIPFSVIPLKIDVDTSQKEKMNALISEADKITVKAKFPAKLCAPVKKGEQLGEIQYFLNNSLLYSVAITANDSIRAIDFSFVAGYIFKTYFNVKNVKNVKKFL